MSMGVGSIPTVVEKRMHFKIIHFMMEAGMKLEATSVVLASAARIYHKFFMHNSTEDYDPYLIGTSSLYLAGKIEEENLRLRDVINVCYRTMYSDKPPLDMGSTYWALREAVTQCELVLLRMMKFHVSFVHPHKYLLHYIKSLYDWMHPTIIEKFPIGRTAWAILRDSYHGSLSLRYDPEHIAVAALYLSMHSYGIEVPSSEDAEYSWWEALVEDLRIERVRRICKEMMDVYQMESQVAKEAVAAPPALADPEAKLPKEEEPVIAQPIQAEKSPEKDNIVTSTSEQIMDIVEPKLEAKFEVAATFEGARRSQSPPRSHSATPTLSHSATPTPPPAPPPAQPHVQVPQIPDDVDDIYMYLYSEELKSEPAESTPPANGGTPTDNQQRNKDGKVFVPKLY